MAPPRPVMAAKVAYGIHWRTESTALGPEVGSNRGPGHSPLAPGPLGRPDPPKLCHLFAIWLVNGPPLAPSLCIDPLARERAKRATERSHWVKRLDQGVAVRPPLAQVAQEPSDSKGGRRPRLDLDLV